VTLRAHPCRRIRVPIVHGVGEGSKRRLDVVPTPFIVESTLDEFYDECTPSTGTGPSIQFGNQLVLQNYVHTHVPTLAHRVSHTLSVWSPT